MPLSHLEMKEMHGKRDQILIPKEESVMSYYKIRQQLDRLGDELMQFVHQPKYCLPYLQPGRLVKVLPCKLLYDTHLMTITELLSTMQLDY